MDDRQELEAQVRHLSRNLDEMRARVARLEGKDPSSEAAPQRASRRGFLRLGAGAAMGALGMAVGKALPAAAADGANIVAGTTVTAEHPTEIHSDAATTTPVFGVNDFTFNSGNLNGAGTFSGPLQGRGGETGTGTPVPVDGVDGWAGGPLAFGVYGLTDSGVGVTGESSTGIGLYARTSGRILQDPQASAGAPGFTANDFEQVRDSAGEMFISTHLVSLPWKRLTTLELFPNPRRIYDGYVQPTAAGTYGPIDATAQVSTSAWPGGPSGVPAGARAAYCAVMSYSAGVMTIYPDGTSDTLIGNWASTTNGPLNLHYMYIPLSPAGKFKIHTYFSGQKFIDVWGYYL